MKFSKKAITSWVRTHRTATIAIAGGGVIAIAAGIAAAVYVATAPAAIDWTPIKVAKRPEKFYSPLTGVRVNNKAATKRVVRAVMIENSPDARPHSGLAEADVVYEAIAEAGITRYAVLYQQGEPKLIGPVRSLRPYFVDWIAPYDAAIAHVGGSAKALRMVRDGSHRDIDQFFNPGAYWRASDRYAPHNVYTSSAKLIDLAKAKKYTASSFKSFARVDEKASTSPDATRVKINFSSPQYATEYRYDKKRNTYTRYLAGELHKDREKGTITPKVIVALNVKQQTVSEDGTREAITTTGTGQATVFQNGTATKVTWRKKTSKAPLELIKGDESFELVRGMTWIAAVPTSGGSVSWK